MMAGNGDLVTVGVSDGDGGVWLVWGGQGVGALWHKAVAWRLGGYWQKSRKASDDAGTQICRLVQETWRNWEHWPWSVNTNVFEDNNLAWSGWRAGQPGEHGRDPHPRQYTVALGTQWRGNTRKSSRDLAKAVTLKVCWVLKMLNVVEGPTVQLKLVTIGLHN